MKPRLALSLTVTVKTGPGIIAPESASMKDEAKIEIIAKDTWDRLLKEFVKCFCETNSYRWQRAMINVQTNFFAAGESA